jgi:hypothetical protein
MKIRNYLLLLVVSAVLPLPNMAHAQIIPVANASFEADVVASGTIDYSNLEDWTASGDSYYGATNPSPSLGAYQNGSNVATVAVSGGGLGSLQQTLSSTFQANTVYTLTVAEGNLDGFPSGTSNTYVSLLAGATSVAKSIPVFAPQYSTSSFMDTSLIFDTSTDPSIVGQAITIQLDCDSTSPYQIAADFDNVRLDAVSSTPEPSTYALLLSGMGVLLWVSRRRLIS